LPTCGPKKTLRFVFDDGAVTHDDVVAAEAREDVVARTANQEVGSGHYGSAAGDLRPRDIIESRADQAVDADIGVEDWGASAVLVVRLQVGDDGAVNLLVRGDIKPVRPGSSRTCPGKVSLPWPISRSPSLIVGPTPPSIRSLPSPPIRWSSPTAARAANRCPTGALRLVGAVAGVLCSRPLRYRIWGSKSPSPKIRSLAGARRSTRPCRRRHGARRRPHRRTPYRARQGPAKILSLPAPPVMKIVVRVVEDVVRRRRRRRDVRCPGFQTGSRCRRRP